MLLLGGCSVLDSLQDSYAAQQAALTTPGQAKPQPKTETPVPAPSPAATAQVAPLTVTVAPPVAGQTQTASAAPDAQVAPRGALTKVALLLPLSGKSAPLGQAMSNAAQQAVFDIGTTGFELLPRDTKGTPEGAVQAARDALASGAELLIGPLFAADVAAVKPVVSSSGVNMLALSTDVSLAEPGAYVMGFAPTPQVERIVAYAAAQGLRRFAAVIPPGPYGQIVTKAFEKSVKQAGGTIVASETPVNIAALAAKKAEIDAIFLPFGGAELRKIAGQLQTAGFEKDSVRLLGTGLWDEPNVAEGQPLLVGGWFVAPEPDARQRFMDGYKESYGQAPPRLATLAYDATALAAVLARSGTRFDRLSLGNPSGFAGVDGLFRLKPDGQIERGLAVQEITPTGIKIVDPSPSTFSGR